jgi:hypothetical protein
MTSSAYYLTGIYRCAQVRDNTRASGAREAFEVWDASLPVIAFSTSPYDAERLFESELRKQPEGEERPQEITIRNFFTGANTQWKPNPIRITPLCGTIGEPA